jgi:D-beta-D-heptose 7-phosphate kinase/D-beta-D-heptose 1-phosphate adenosyltransferase
MKKVLVIGDSCVDVFEYGKVKRISPEAPVPILIPVEERQTSGMTLNVWANLCALGINADVLTNSDRPIKKRYVEENSNHMLLRVDRNDNVSTLNWSYLRNTSWLDYDAIVISDYDKGFLDREQIQYISESHQLTFMDSKKQLGEWCNNIRYIKLNDKEAHENWKYLHEEYRNDIIVTKGKDGAAFNFRNVFLMDIDDQHPVRDLTGAGDTFLAGMVAEFLKSGGNIFQAIEFANKCAAWVVTQRGVTIIDPTKIEKGNKQ